LQAKEFVFGQPARRPPRPQSAYGTIRSAKPGKSEIQKIIDGVTGPPMTGVATYPFSANERHYKEDFRALVASQVTHPFMAITSFNVPSVPHHLLRGSAFDDGKLCKHKEWSSEYKRAYPQKSATVAFKMRANGLRSEEMMFVG